MKTKSERKVRFSGYIRESTLEALTEIAKEQKRPLMNLTRNILEEYVEKQAKP